MTAARLDPEQLDWAHEQADRTCRLCDTPALLRDVLAELEAVNAENRRLQGKHHAVWQVVATLRSAAVAEGRDPYQDPVAQALSLALVKGEIAEDANPRSAG